MTTAVPLAGRNIVILCDGTGNTSSPSADGQVGPSNVHRLFKLLQNERESEWRQVLWYDSGVGTGTSSESALANTARRVAEKLKAGVPAMLATLWMQARMIVELAFGVGIGENIVEGYTQIVRLYRPGDRIFLFGFSRGAYTARCIAGVIARCGLLRGEHIRLAPDVVTLFRYRNIKSDDPPTRLSEPDLFHPPETTTVAFLGCWDTVASIGVPLWGWWFRIGNLWDNRALDTSPAPVCERIRHAVSMDERRSQFFVTLFDESEAAFKDALRRRGLPDRDLDIKQVWFRGAHAGVGGGYADSAVADVPLRWMAGEAADAGLLFRSAPPAGDWRGTVHNELSRQRAWYLFGTWPRWHPCLPSGETSQGFGTLHDSVHERAKLARSLRLERAAADPTVAVDTEELLRLGPGQKARITARADRQWNRSGVVIEQDMAYALTWDGKSSWRDKECGLCGPAGQGPGFEFRALVGFLRRLSGHPWMMLVATVAHPRAWPPAEKPGWELLRYLLVQDPPELERQLIPIGVAMEKSPSTAPKAALARGFLDHLRRAWRASPRTGPATSVGVPVVLASAAPSGMLHLFANDAWLFHGNNTGALELEIECVGDAAALEAWSAEPRNADATCFLIETPPESAKLRGMGRSQRETRSNWQSMSAKDMPGADPQAASERAQ